MDQQYQELPPLPFSKHTRVWFEVIRTLAAISQVTINLLVVLKVFGKI